MTHGRHLVLPHCGSNQPTAESWEAEDLKIRCQTCGYPVDDVKGFQAGATLAIQKPFDPNKLIVTIKTALALQAKRPAG